MVFNFFGMPVPAPVKKLTENKLIFGMGAFFLGGQIQSALLSTNAFEISINNQLVYSKLETGTMPTMPELTQLFAANGLPGLQ